MKPKRSRSPYPTIDRLNAHLDALDGPFIVRAVATQFLHNERLNHPGDLQKLIDHLVLNMVIHAARKRLQRVRHLERNAAIRNDLEASVEEALATGERRNPFASRHVVDAENTWKTVGEMIGRDHRYVSRSYRDEAKPLQMLAAFHLAIARRCGNNRTDEVMDEDTYLALYRSIAKGQPDAADAA